MSSISNIARLHSRPVGEIGRPFSVCESRFYRAMGLLVMVLLPGALILSKSMHLCGLGQLIESWPVGCLVGGCIAYFRWRPLPKLIQSAQLAMVSLLMESLLPLLVLIAARSPYPLVDRRLAALDASVHFHTVYFVHAVEERPVIRLGLLFAYWATGWLMVAAATVPPLVGHPERSYRFILAVVLALVVTVLAFYRWPAIGPWTVEGFAPASHQAAVTEYMGRLRSGAHLMIDMNNAGVVSFPSFHVVVAILSAYALNCVRGVRWFVWVLSVLICVSTISTGWHYGVDVIGGLIVAAGSIAVADRVLPAAPCRRTFSL